MARLLDLVAVFLAISSACILYGLKYDARRIESRVHAQQRAVDKAESEIAALRAERAYLGRLERIELLARTHGLAPIRERQYQRVGEAFEDGIARILDRPDSDGR